MNDLVKYLSHQPTFEEMINVKSQLKLADQSYYKSLISEINKDSKLIFVIGKWGSGKTSALKQIHEFESGIHFNFINFFGVKTAEEAQNHLLGLWANLINCAILSFAVIKLQESIAVPTYKIISIITSIFISYFVVKKSRVVFTLNLLLRYSLNFFRNSRTILVIEDLDRSPMSFDEKFSFLAQLPPYLGQYIVTYGYADINEEIDLVEITSKLNAKLINLKPNPQLVFQIITKNIPNFPFTQYASWMSEISLRRHIKICLSLNELTSAMLDVERNMLLIEIYFKEIIKPLIPADRDETDIALRFDSVFKYSTQLNMTTREANLITSFVNSADSAYFSNHLINTVPAAQQRSPANWQEVEYRKIKSGLPLFDS